MVITFRYAIESSAPPPTSADWGLGAPDGPPPARSAHEDEHLPPALVVHPGSGNWSGTLLNALLRHRPALVSVPRAGIVHRLDKDTSGLLVVAKTLAAHTDLVRQLQARDVTREYLARIESERSDGVRAQRLLDLPGGRTARAV